jgi:predicted Ser/Thr protein kinase
MSHPVSV